MARAGAASASLRTDSISGLAQSIAKPAYRRLLTAEPALRRAVPILIVAFLLTQKARWTIPEFLLMMIAGLIPGLIFWVERRVAARIAPKLTAGATS